MLDYSQNPASYDYRLQGFSLQALSQDYVNEIPIYGYIDANIGISYVEFVFSVGKLSDSSKALSSIVSRLFSYLKTSNGDTLFELLEFYGAKLSFEPSSTHSSIKLYALSEDFEKIIGEVDYALKLHKWDDTSFKHTKNTLSRDIKTRKLEKKTISDQAFNTHFYCGSKLSRSMSLADIASVTELDVSNKISGLFEQLDFVVTVNLNPSQLNLSSFQLDSQRAQVNNTFVGRDVKVFPKLDKEQSIIQSITSLCHINDEKYLLYYFYNQLLGGSFQSVLSQEIREKQGLTYGIHSSLLTVDNQCYLRIKSTTPYKKGNEVLTRIDAITSDFESFLNETYLEQIKKISTASFLKNMENTFSQLALQKNILLSNLKPDFYSCLLEGIKAVTIDDLLVVNNEFRVKDTLKIIVE